MIVVGAAIAVVGLVFAARRIRVRCMAFGAGLAIHPLVAIAAIACVVLLEKSRHLSRAKDERRHARDDEILAVELVAAGVSGGVAFDAAVHTAAPHVEEDVAATMIRHLRLARHGHTPPNSDSVVAEMIRVAQTSEASGAAVADQLRALADSALAHDEASVNERNARLPIKMLFPLALLILPGFLLVAVVPAIVSGIAKLGL